MKKKLKLFFKTVFISSVCCAIFVGAGYFYLQNKLEPAENSAESVPYYSFPENAGVLFSIGEEKTLIYLDFEGKTVSAVFADGLDLSSGELYGYPLDYTVEGDYSLVGDIVDLVGGIDLAIEGEELSLTGVQIEEILSASPSTADLRQSIIEKIISKIRQNGFTKENFLHIIENSNTDLTMPVCYYWSQYMEEACTNLMFIN